MNPVRTILAVAVMLTTLSACHRKGDEVHRVAEAWVRLPAVPDRPGAAYFTLAGTEKPDRLVAIRSAVVDRIELHESGMAGGMMTMRPLAGVDIPAGASIEFKPGGNHAMLFAIDKAIQPGTAIPMRFLFASGKAEEVEAKTVGPGGDKPY